MTCKKNNKDPYKLHYSYNGDPKISYHGDKYTDYTELNEKLVKKLNQQDALIRHQQQTIIILQEQIKESLYLLSFIQKKLEGFDG